jgi:hypothetical protein
MPHPTQPLAHRYPMFTYLENQLPCPWWRIPIHPCPWSVNNCPTLCYSSHPFTPHRSRYNIYIDDISNSSHPRLAQYHSTENTLYYLKKNFYSEVKYFSLYGQNSRFKHTIDVHGIGKCILENGFLHRVRKKGEGVTTKGGTQGVGGRKRYNS